MTGYPGPRYPGARAKKPTRTDYHGARAKPPKKTRAKKEARKKKPTPFTNCWSDR